MYDFVVDVKVLLDLFSVSELELFLFYDEYDVLLMDTERSSFMMFLYNLFLFY